MPVTADIEIPAEKFVLGQVLQDVGEYTAELTQFVPLRDQFVPYFWIEHGDPDQVAPTLREHPQVGHVTKYDERAGRTLYELEWAGPLDAFLSVLMEQDVLVTEASGNPDVWEFGLLASEQETLATFQAACNQNDIPTEIRTVSQSGPSHLDRVGLTEKQRHIIRMAHEHGYFNVPREVTVAELADELDISPQAASKRLRRGLETTIEFLFSDV